MKVVILQPSYIPWRGYFHQIHMADLFVFLDDVQYDKNGWRNRNRIKTAAGTRWLTIPVLTKGTQSANLLIKDTRIHWTTKKWNWSHRDIIYQNYKQAPYFEQYLPILQDFYQRQDVFLPDFTIELTIALSRELGLKTSFLRSSALEVTSSRTDRLVEILNRVGATHYITGPAAKEYLEEDKLKNAGISLEYMDYNYPEYPQLYSPFDPQVSILDLLFMTGPEAPRYIWNQQ